MLVTNFTRTAHAERKFAQEMIALGYEEIDENGHPLWELRRGGRTRERILDAKVSPTGYRVFIKIGEKEHE